ncbi:unnamed protein product [Kuraishia capsulata CBS 1993]|uniref:GLC7-interacting protein 3 n=1 Tax=Kuraishia capsulata CBS 1993 TaxID=1382522 RepID=W6MXU3_9ASCO|nr:uncharacterized protein KUCA_T00005473001 [Kuraishia capsulata CBS 1993]CDK29485.1 unnamed protein product [Kuraishia capsulata CBS 1993]
MEDSNGSPTACDAKAPNSKPVITEQSESSGVSNGDVDWLFRGKESKKLARKTDRVLTARVPSLSKDVINEQTTRRRSSEEPERAKLSITTSIDDLQDGLPQRRRSTGNALVGDKTVPDDPRKASVVQAKAPVSVLKNSGRSRSVSDPAVPVESFRKMAFKEMNSPSTSAPVEGLGTSPGSASKKSFLSSISSKFSSKNVPAVPQVGLSPTQSSLGASPVEKKGLFGMRNKAPSDIKREGSVKRTSSEVRRVSVAAPTVAPVKEDPLKKTVLKRVTFSLDKLQDDPQQQIPSRRPRKGNVLIPEDLTAEPARLTIGITDSNNNDAAAKKPMIDEKELALALDTQRQALIEAQHHAQEAHLAAQRVAKEVAAFKKKSYGAQSVADEAEDESLYSHSQNVEIDKPLHEHIDYFEVDGEEPVRHGRESGYEDGEDEDEREIPLDVVYTRCCHLREILPIPATLKQLKGKSRPLQILKLLNPKPTLIDVLSFADFLAITPIAIVIFDNVTMNNEMLKVFLTSLVNSKGLEKLSLRNVAMDSEGWLYLCKFLTLNKSLSKLDISQQKVKSDTPRSHIRSQMNWDLFTECVAKRGGLVELVINGCKLTDEQFSKLIRRGVMINTLRLGVAATNLSVGKSATLASWVTDPKSSCVGLDIAFNDLSEGQLRPCITQFATNYPPKLMFFSINSTNVKLDDCVDLIKTLSKLPNIRFLDLSNNPHLFPKIIPVLTEYLPKFADLRRIHLEFSNLTSPQIVAIASILSKCKQLIHVSLLGNQNIGVSAALSLYSMVKASNVYVLDVDFDLISDVVSSKIAFYLMRNMERNLNNDLTHDNDDEDLIFDGSILTQTAEKILEAKYNSADSNSDDDVSKQIISKALIERTTRLRKEIHKTMDKFFEQRRQGTLSLQGKETLLRFCLLDSSLEKVVQIFEEADDHETASPAPATQLKLPMLPLDLHMHRGSSDMMMTGPIVSPNLKIIDESTYFAPQAHGATAVNSEQPHQVVVENSVDGKTRAVDEYTGKPVLFRKLSQTSIHAKAQEEEEGEFHRWGFFVQQQDPFMTPQLNILPSGPELREAVIKAKGIESVSDLIGKIDQKRDPVGQDSVHWDATSKDQVQSEEPQSPVSIGSDDEGDAGAYKHERAVDEVYEKLLDDVVRVRSNSMKK